MERTSNKLIIWIRCVNKERHAKYAERGGARTGIENLWFSLLHFEYVYMPEYLACGQ